MRTVEAGGSGLREGRKNRTSLSLSVAVTDNPTYGKCLIAPHFFVKSCNLGIATQLIACPIISTKPVCCPAPLHCYNSRPLIRGPKGSPGRGSRGFDGTTIRNEIVAPYLVGGLSEAGKIVRLGIQFICQYAEELRNIRRIIGDVPRLYRGHAQERDGLLHGSI